MTETAETQRERPSLLVNVTLAAVSLLGVALAAELALRFVLLRNLNPFEPDPAVGFRMKRSFDGAYPRVRVRTDRNGLRVAGDQDEDSSGRFLFVGDSVTFGYSVRADEAFPHLVASRLGEPRDAANAAVPGYNLDQTLFALRENLARQRPEWIVFGLVVNDLGSALSPATYADIDPHAARASGGFLSRSMLVAFVQRRVRRLFDRVGERVAEQSSANVVLDFDVELDAATVAAFDRQWQQLDAVATQANLPVYVVIAPFAYQVHEAPELDALQRFARARCHSSLLTCLDPRPLFLRHAGEELFTPGSSYHFSPRGHALLADWLVEQLRAGAASAEPPAAPAADADEAR